LLQGLIDSTALKNRGMKLDSSLRVLKNATMPAALVEMGFISNAQEEKWLASEEGQNGIVNSIFTAFGQYYNNIK
jgi:N-acetylmuramoyl-L-alanine amidase